ncbi:hypothetical protein POPTR_010G101500v4 [Populus trichocarpa]|uniref:Uncharacterized protein n=1 Tax=Populus trichocarpa TaxID=3694 RepID=B9HVQ9_POPTR|nr:uncharacterized protein LOC7459090 [Populus trichocarpa]XP_061976824.1 uncharacterized protein LOC133697991 isoform X2 [Populus nigra]PNT15727.1 hypothetical protein POPTR_010G101500v4 [Populus trichocarpa]|eukprot:XP_002314756.1 uncharacterized protein LOC7459090 isoform X2 [Populus trichocarpa]
MGLSCGEDDFEKNESHGVPLIIESGETRARGGYMDLQHHHHPVEFDVEFWPVEHPMEPQDEDRPVKCPMPTSSVIKNGRAHEESLEKRADDLPLPAVMNKQGIFVVAAEPQVRAVRKRHHTLTRPDHRVIAPNLARMASLPAIPTQNVTIFQMLQEFDKFDQY